MSDPPELAPAYYANPMRNRSSRWASWWTLLHPPYTLWHLSYVVIGATIAPKFDGVAFLRALKK